MQNELAVEEAVQERSMKVRRGKGEWFIGWLVKIHRVNNNFICILLSLYLIIEVGILFYIYVPIFLHFLFNAPYICISMSVF